MNEENLAPDAVAVHTGFPNPATDSSLQELDLNRLLIQHSAGTYLMRIAGNNWQKYGMSAGDIVLVDRVLSPQTNDYVVWWHMDAFAISPFHQLPEGATIWGVVTSVIHQYRGNKCDE